MGRKLLDLPSTLTDRGVAAFDWREDWRKFVPGEEWSAYLTGSAAAGLNQPGAPGDVLQLRTVDSTLNRELYVYQTIPAFQFLADRPFAVEALIQFADADPTNNAGSLAFGLMSGVGAGALANNTGEPQSSFSGAVIYKVPGGTTWKCCSSVGTTRTTTATTQAAGDTAAHRLRVEFRPLNATLAEVLFLYDGAPLLVPSTALPGTFGVKHQLTYTGAAGMSIFLGLKNGSTTPQSMTCSWVQASGFRP